MAGGIGPQPDTFEAGLDMRIGRTVITLRGGTDTQMLHHAAQVRRQIDLLRRTVQQDEPSARRTDGGHHAIRASLPPQP